MTRAGFFTTLAAIAALPFNKPSEPARLPRDRRITGHDVEEMVAKEVERRMSPRLSASRIREIIEAENQRKA